MHMLFVDDDLETLTFLKQAAALTAFKDVDTATSAEDALTRVVTSHYDLITLDINMPGASGLEVLPLIRSMSPHAIIAIISGFIPKDLSNSLAGCADVFLPKPISINTLKCLIDNVHPIHQSLSAIRLLNRESTPIIHTPPKNEYV
jgi:two-component system response regulator PilR (NtrC family)